MEPATTIIRKLGGPTKVSAIVGIHRTRVSSWQRSKASGGTGGRIPQSHYRAILRAASLAGITDITAERLIPIDNEASK